MSDGGFRNRVKGLFAPAEGELLEPVPAAAAFPDPDAERQALQVLVLAQRTADDHIASAQREADRIRSDALARVEELAQQSQANADEIRREANQVLADAQARAEQISRDARSRADGVRRDAQNVLSEAQAKAEEIIEDSEARAEQLDRESQQRYQEVVGSLESQRAALQEEIDALQQFDKDYRAKLAKFMVTQLRVLGVDEHGVPVNDDPQAPVKERRQASSKDRTERSHAGARSRDADG